MPTIQERRHDDGRATSSMYSMVRSLVGDKRLFVVRAEEAMTTVERLRAEIEGLPDQAFLDSGSWHINDATVGDLRAILKAGEEDHAAISGVLEGEPQSSVGMEAVKAYTRLAAALAKLRSLGFGAKP